MWSVGECSTNSPCNVRNYALRDTFNDGGLSLRCRPNGDNLGVTFVKETVSAPQVGDITRTATFFAVCLSETGPRAPECWAGDISLFLQPGVFLPQLLGLGCR